MDGMDPENVKGMEEEDVVMTVLDGVMGLVGCMGLARAVLLVHGKDDIIPKSPVRDPL